MKQFDSDATGTISFDEFKNWWKENGGDLEAKRDVAFTIFAVRLAEA